MENNFFDLAKYSEVPEIDNIGEDKALQELNWYSDHSNCMAYDMIDYERLVFLELRFPESTRIQTKINDLKIQIYENYILRKKIEHRFFKDEYCS